MIYNNMPRLGHCQRARWSTDPLVVPGSCWTRQLQLCALPSPALIHSSSDLSTVHAAVVYDGVQAEC